MDRSPIIAGLTQAFTLAFTPEGKLEQLVDLYVFGVWEETEAPRGNPHRENAETPHRKAPVGRKVQTQSPAWGEATVLTMAAPLRPFGQQNSQICLLVTPIPEIPFQWHKYFGY